MKETERGREKERRDIRERERKREKRDKREGEKKREERVRYKKEKERERDSDEIENSIITFNVHLMW